MVKFLVTVILALLIFAPTCMFTSKLFRLSDQAKENFKEFAILVREAHQTQQQRAHLLVLDKDSFVVGYTANKNTEICTAQGSCGTTLYPPECGGESCVCLCREYQGTGFTTGGESITCSKRSCENVGQIEFQDNLLISNFHQSELYQGELPPMPPALAQGYFRNGFMIIRGPLEFSGFTFNFQDVRRIPLTVVPASDNMAICRELPCKFYDKPSGSP